MWACCTRYAHVHMHELGICAVTEVMLYRKYGLNVTADKLLQQGDGFRYGNDSPKKDGMKRLAAFSRVGILHD